MAADVSNTHTHAIPRRRGPKSVRVVDLSSSLAHDYADYVATKGWSPSTGRRRERVVGAYIVPGIPKKQIVPARAEAILRNERGRLRHGPDRPRRGAL